MTDKAQLRPAENLRDAKELLERPFMPSAAEFVVISAKEGKSKAQIATYISRTSVEDRLDFAVGSEHWEAEYVPHDECVECRLTVFGTTKSSLGTGRDRRSQEANAFKRAARCFGVGRYLYKRGPIYKPIGDGAKQVRRNGRSGWIPRALEAELREEYRAYLSEVAIPAHGEPIDHQDNGRGQGDVDVETAPSPPRATENGVARNGGGRPTAIATNGDGAAPAHPNIRKRLRSEIEAGSFSGDTVADLAELLYGERISDRLAESQLGDLAEALSMANAGKVADKTLGGLASRALQREDRTEAGKEVLAYLLGKAGQEEASRA